MALKHVLILGAKGTLGGQLLKLYPEATGWDREEVDVLDFPSLRGRIDALGFVPDAIINCVAFNDVDGAEDHPGKAFALNSEYVGKLAEYAKERGVPLVHYSTNYVFDGAKGEYAESDAPAPLSVYGRSKLRGEQLVVESGWGYAVRTAVIFGPKGESDLSKKSFVDIMLDLSSKRDTIQVVSDEVNSVTYAPDLAVSTCDLLSRMPPPGVYHATNSGGASWFEFAKEIFRIAGRSINMIPVPSTHFPRKATRPAKAILLNTKLPPLRPWQAALAEFLTRALLLGVLAVLPLRAQAPAGDEAAVREVVAKYVDAREQRDASAVEALFTADADQLVSSGEWRKGRPAVVRGTMASSQSTGGKRTITVESVRFVAPAIALVDGRYELTELAGGATRRMWTTLVVTRGPDGWRIAAIRNMLPSTPAPAR
jgi:dTDP-4-dehydrorhamnose reductase